MRTLAQHTNSPALEQACTHYILQHLSSVVAEQQQQQSAQQRSTGSSSTESSVVIGAGQQLMVQQSDRKATRESSEWVSLVAAFFDVLTPQELEGVRVS
jgi:hypothetical protein